MTSGGPLPTTSRAWRLPQCGADGHQALKLVEDKVPQLESDQVLVKIYAVALNFHDLHIALGTLRTPPIPNVIPLCDMSGQIIALGSTVKGLKLGDRVSASRVWDHIHGEFKAHMLPTISGNRCDGMLTEYKVLPVHALVAIPDHLTYEEGACLPCSGVTAWTCLHGPRPVKGGDYVLVQGTGGVAVFAIQFAAACGANVIVVSSSDAKLEVAKSLGAHHLINYNKTQNWDEEVKRITCGEGVDHIIEIGGPGTLSRSVKSISFGGYIHAVGFVNETGGEHIDITRAAMAMAFTVRGIFVGSVAAFRDMNRLVSSRKLKPVVDKVFRFEEAIDAYDYLASQKHIGKVVIKVF